MNHFAGNEKIIFMDNKQNEHWAYLCSRVQKITEAVYRVTDILSDKEPLKWEIREKAISVFNVLVSLEGDNYLEKISRFSRIESLINQLVLMLSFLPVNFSLSGINFEILKDEYLAVTRIITEEKHRFDFGKILLQEKKLTPELPNGHDELSIGHTDNGQSAKGQGNGQIIDKKTSEQKPSTVDRKKRILDFVKDKERVTVGELASLFSEYSEKTLQRDLLEMVDRGVLMKEGDKRWRSYVLKDKEAQLS